MPTEVDNGFTGECFPELFDINARPKVTKQKLGQLSEEEIQQYFEKVKNSILTSTLYPGVTKFR